MRTFCIALLGATALSGCSMTVAGSIPDAKGHVRPYTLHIDSRAAGRDLVAKSVGFTPIFAAADKTAAEPAGAAVPPSSEGAQPIDVAAVATEAMRLPAQIEALRRDLALAITVTLGSGVLGLAYVATGRRRRAVLLAAPTLGADVVSAHNEASAPSALDTVVAEPAAPELVVALSASAVEAVEHSEVAEHSEAVENSETVAAEPDAAQTPTRRCSCDAPISAKSRTGRCRRCAQRTRAPKPRALHVEFPATLAAPKARDDDDDSAAEPLHATLALSRIGKHRQYYVVAGDRLTAAAAATGE